MSRDPLSASPIPTLLPAEHGDGGGLLEVGSDLHPQLQAQLRKSGAAGSPAATLSRLLPLISSHYEKVDEERRGVVRSMQLLAEEARSFSQGLASEDEGQMRAILDHIKDVVVTVTADGAVCVFNPTGEQLFGYSQSEVIGASIEKLLPGLAVQGSIERGLRAFAVPASGQQHQIEARPTEARRKDGSRFPVEVVASQVRIGRRDVYVFCLRDMSEREQAERALRESEGRFRTLVENAPEVIVVIDTRTGACTDGNRNALHFFGVTRAGLGTLMLDDLLRAAPPATEADAAAESLDAQTGELAVSPLPQPFEWRFRNGQGESLVTEVRLVRLPGPAGLVRASVTDVTDRRRAQDIMAGERELFGRMAADAPLREVLEAIVALVSAVSGYPLVGLMRLAPDGQSFAEVIGPRLPALLRSAEEQTTIDVRNGSSAAAVYLGRTVIVGNVRTDPYWQRQRELATQVGLAAAWAVPVKAAGGGMLGALTVYREQPGKPQERDLELLAHAARLAAIAIERRYAAEALRESESRFRGLYESMREGVYRISNEGRLLAVNPAFVRTLGFESPEQVYALPSVAALYWDPAGRAQLMAALERDGEVHNAEVQLRRRDGQQVTVLISARLLRDAQGDVIAHEGTLADITARKRAEQAVFEEKERAQVTLQSIGDGVITTDREGRIDYLNPVAEQLSGWRAADAQGASILNVLRLRDEQTRSEIENPLLRCLREDKVVHFGEHSVLVNRLGQEIAIQDSAAPIRDRDGRTVGAVVVFRDVTKERRLKRALSFQASHDALTGLINRREFDNRLQAALLSAREGEGPHALLYVDLDQFKVVNDTCGHPAGDRLLRDVTALLQQHVRAADVIARLGGDEFGILVQHCSIEQAAHIAEGIRQAVRDYRFAWEENAASIGASIGVVDITAQSDSVAAILSAADIACYAAKDSGRNRVHIYDAGEVSGRHREMYWVSRVTRAVDANRLELYAQQIQPLGEATPLAPLFLELLVRLRGDQGELVLPGEFIPAAERYNIVGAIDRWVVEHAVELLRAELAAGRVPPLLAVNLSANSIGERSFLDAVLALVEDPAVARSLCFEISESALVSGRSQVLSFMSELRKRGCRFTIDDFGSGLSSFQQLKALPVDFLKVDGRYIAGVEADPVDRHMVEVINKVAEALGIVTIAERVESREALERLTEVGIGHAQGNELAPPRPLAELLRGQG
jgi:diguanylate cyclase (GGDEF)-like protein/PAS domain S-box-containing protein